MVAEARQFVGVPWKHQGRDPATGIDCVGLVVLYLRQLGIEPDDRADYGPDPDGSLWAEICRCLGAPVATGRGSAREARAGDVVVLEFTSRAPRHVGIVSEFQGAPHLIHADSAKTVRKVVEIPLDRRWASRIVGVWRIA